MQYTRKCTSGMSITLFMTAVTFHICEPAQLDLPFSISQFSLPSTPLHYWRVPNRVLYSAPFTKWMSFPRFSTTLGCYCGSTKINETENKLTFCLCRGASWLQILQTCCQRSGCQFPGILEVRHCGTCNGYCKRRQKCEWVGSSVQGIYLFGLLRFIRVFDSFKTSVLKHVHLIVISLPFFPSHKHYATWIIW